MNVSLFNQGLILPGNFLPDLEEMIIGDSNDKSHLEPHKFDPNNKPYTNWRKDSDRENDKTQSPIEPLAKIPSYIGVEPLNFEGKFEF